MRKVNFQVHHPQNRYQYQRGGINPGWYVDIPLAQLALPPDVQMRAMFTKNAIVRGGRVIDSFDNFLAVTAPFLKGYDIECVNRADKTRAYRSKSEVLGELGRSSDLLSDYLNSLQPKEKSTLHKVYVYSNPKKPELGELVTVSIDQKLEAVLEVAPPEARFFYSARTAPVIVIPPEHFKTIAACIMQEGATLSKPIKRTYTSPRAFLRERNAVKAQDLIITDQDVTKLRVLVHKETNQLVRVRTHFHQQPSDREEGVGSFVHTLFVLENDSWVATNHWLASREYRPPTALELARFNQQDMFEDTRDKTSLVELGRQVAHGVHRGDGDAIEATAYAFQSRSQNNHEEEAKSPLGIVRLKKDDFRMLWQDTGHIDLSGGDVRISEGCVYFTPMAFSNFRAHLTPEVAKRVLKTQSGFLPPDDYQNRSLSFDPYWMEEGSLGPGAVLLFDDKPAYWMGTFSGEQTAYKLQRADTVTEGHAYVPVQIIMAQNPDAKPSDCTVVIVDGRRYLWDNTVPAGRNLASVVDERGRVHIDLIGKLLKRIKPPIKTPELAPEERPEPKPSEVAHHTMLGLLSRLNNAQKATTGVAQPTMSPTQTTLGF